MQGRKYHISALYVVDLKKFRRIAAGDRLRGQYQALSQDPNSLSNLDQVVNILIKNIIGFVGQVFSIKKLKNLNYFKVYIYFYIYIKEINL